jgi:hypothetical protein
MVPGCPRLERRHYMRYRCHRRAADGGTARKYRNRPGRSRTLAAARGRCAFFFTSAMLFGLSGMLVATARVTRVEPARSCWSRWRAMSRIVREPVGAALRKASSLIAGKARRCASGRPGRPACEQLLSRQGVRGFEHTVIKDQRTAKWTANTRRPAGTHGYAGALDHQVEARDAAGRQVA